MNGLYQIYENAFQDELSKIAENKPDSGVVNELLVPAAYGLGIGAPVGAGAGLLVGNLLKKRFQKEVLQTGLNAGKTVSRFMPIVKNSLKKLKHTGVLAGGLGGAALGLSAGLTHGITKNKINKTVEDHSDKQSLLQKVKNSLVSGSAGAGIGAGVGGAIGAVSGPLVYKRFVKNSLDPIVKEFYPAHIPTFKSFNKIYLKRSPLVGAAIGAIGAGVLGGGYGLVRGALKRDA